MYGDCVFDVLDDPVLTGHNFQSSKMTVEMCVSTCKEKKFGYAGLKKRKKCFCGNEPLHGFQWAWLDKCDDECTGNSDQICGGSDAMTVYTL